MTIIVIVNLLNDRYRYLEAEDPENGIEEEYHPKHDVGYMWRARRLLSAVNLPAFRLMTDGDINAAIAQKDSHCIASIRVRSRINIAPPKSVAKDEKEGNKAQPAEGGAETAALQENKVTTEEGFAGKGGGERESEEVRVATKDVDVREVHEGNGGSNQPLPPSQLLLQERNFQSIKIMGLPIALLDDDDSWKEEITVHLSTIGQVKALRVLSAPKGSPVFNAEALYTSSPTHEVLENFAADYTFRETPVTFEVLYHRNGSGNSNGKGAGKGRKRGASVAVSIEQSAESVDKRGGKQRNKRQRE